MQRLLSTFWRTYTSPFDGGVSTRFQRAVSSLNTQSGVALGSPYRRRPPGIPALPAPLFLVDTDSFIYLFTSMQFSSRRCMGADDVDSYREECVCARTCACGRGAERQREAREEQTLDPGCCRRDRRYNWTFPPPDLWSPLLLLLEPGETSGPPEPDAFAVPLEVSSCCSPPHRRPSSLPGCGADLTATLRRQRAPFPGKFWRTGNFWPGVRRLCSRGGQALSDDSVPCCHPPDRRRWVPPAENTLWHFLVSTQAGMWISAAPLPWQTWVFDRFIMEKYTVFIGLEQSNNHITDVSPLGAKDGTRMCVFSCKCCMA